MTFDALCAAVCENCVRPVTADGCSSCNAGFTGRDCCDCDGIVVDGVCKKGMFCYHGHINTCMRVHLNTAKLQLCSYSGCEGSLIALSVYQLLWIRCS